MTTAIVVGSGPNGLAAALTLAAAGVEVTVLEAGDEPGGGLRSGDSTASGLIHDFGAGFHPFTPHSRFLRRFDLEQYGLVWKYPDVQIAHPLDIGGAALVRDVAETAQAFGADCPSWKRLWAPLIETFQDTTDDFTQPLLRLPEHPVALARFGRLAVRSVERWARRFNTAEVRGLLAGLGAHSFQPFGKPASAAVGVALTAAAQHRGWPVVQGGSMALARALECQLNDLGGSVKTGVHVRSIRELDADIVMLDTAPEVAADICGDRMPVRFARALRRFERPSAVYQVSFAVSGGIPWRYRPARNAGVVHVGGQYKEIAATQEAIRKGRMPARPFTLVGQQFVADPSRSHNDVHPVDVYAQVPHNWDKDAVNAIEWQIERFAPGFRERIIARRSRSTAELNAQNPNQIGGDIIAGTYSGLSLVFRPRFTARPYSTGVRGVFLCSAATPPGAGAHGLCGFNAAQAALREVGLA